MTTFDQTISKELLTVSGFLAAHADDECPEYDIVMALNTPNPAINSTPGALSHLEDKPDDPLDAADGVPLSHDLSVFACAETVQMVVPADRLLEKCLAKSLDAMGEPYRIVRVSEWLGDAVIMDGGMPENMGPANMDALAEEHARAMSAAGRPASAPPSVHVLVANMSRELQGLLFDIRYGRVNDDSYAASLPEKPKGALHRD